MDPRKLYMPQLSLLKFYGFKLKYQNNWKDFRMKLLAISTFSILNLGSIFLLYNITVGQPTVEVFSECFAIFIVSVEVSTKIAVFYLWSYKIQTLFRIMAELLNSGQSLSEKRFNEISKVGNWLLKVYFASGMITASGYAVGALYGNIFGSRRVLPFKGR